MKRLGITMGDPAGIGPEIVAKVILDGDILRMCTPVVYGDQNVLGDAAGLIGAGWQAGGGRVSIGGHSVEIVSPPGSAVGMVKGGELSPAGAVAMMEFVKGATIDAAAGKLHGIVTCPITKEGIKLAGYDYPGHTEFIRDLTGAGRVVMMLAGEMLRVALVTIHISLKEALSSLTEDLIFETIEIVDREFRVRLGIEGAKIAVAGVNPHAGEGGLFGTEEDLHVVPAIERAQKAGIDASGPFSPDTIFYRSFKGEFDVVICMYHDQGLIPLKLLHFEDGVNVTLGLPIVRTSVDHGTAYDIAWKGVASETSLKAAVGFALRMIQGGPGGS